jgi:hypothetical protein
MIRATCFTAFGLILGAGYVVLMYHVAPNDIVGLVFWGIFLPFFFGFMGWGTSQNEEWSDLQRVAFLVLWPMMMVIATVGFWLFILILVLALPVFVVQAMLAARRFRNRMKSDGRFISLPDLRPKLEAGEGTLIEETGHKGPYRIWWTEDNLLGKGTPPSADEDFVAIFEGKDNPFNSLCLREYLDSDSGKAMLTPLPARYAQSGRLARMFPRMQIVMLVRPLLEIGDHRGRDENDRGRTPTID